MAGQDSWRVSRSEIRRWGPPGSGAFEDIAFRSIRMTSRESWAGPEMGCHDPYYPALEADGHMPIRGLPLRNVALNSEVLRESDNVLILANHGRLGYQKVTDHAPLVVATRGVIRGVTGSARTVGLLRPSTSAHPLTLLV